MGAGFPGNVVALARKRKVPLGEYQIVPDLAARDAIQGGSLLPGLLVFVQSPGDLYRLRSIDNTGTAVWDEVEKLGRVETTAATPAQVVTATQPDDTAMIAEATIIGRDEAGTHRCAYKRRALVHRDGGGGATIEGAVQDALTIETDAGLDATIDVNANDVRITVTGLAGTDIDWAARLTLDQADDL